MSSGAAECGEQDELLVSRLHASLRSAGVELSPRELGDLLWLALHESPGPATAAAPQSDAVRPPPPAPEADAPPERSGRGKTPADAARRPVYALTGAHVGGAAGAPLRIPAVRGLRHPLGVVRALRALKRRVPSAHRHELDENATAEAIAESGVLDAVLRPAEDRWLHLVLAVDDGPSMRVWRDTVGELVHALTGSGIFRSVHVSPLDAADPLTGDRTAVLALTDGVGDHWYTGAAHERLAALARRAPTAVLHLFPTRLWSGTGLAAEPMIVRTTGPAPPNSLLAADDPWLPAAESLRPGLPVPVLELDEPSLRSWADLIASHGAVAALRVVDAGRLPETVPLDEGVTGEPDTVAARVRTFRATASPHAYELAGHLAAVDPLTLPVMRLVQAAALPDSSPVCLAEVLLSGLMHVGEPLEDQDVFVFAPDVRGVLRTVVTAGSANRTVDAVNDYIVPRLGRTPDFPAVIADRTGTLTLPRGGAPLAELWPVTAAQLRLPWLRIHNLPDRRVFRRLTAHEKDVAWVERTLGRGARVPVALCGPAGSDKTTVALEYAHRYLNDYEMVWWVDASSERTRARGIASLGETAFRGLSFPPEGMDAEEATLQWLAARGGWLLVLDHVTDERDVERLVDRMGATRGRVLVTTRMDVGTWRTAASRDLTPAYLARHDPVTGLRDGRTLREQLSGLLCADPQSDDTTDHRHIRVPSEDPEVDRYALAVLYCTLDGFESVIHRFGHDAGDAVLAEVARRLRDAVRGDDTVARVAEAAFVILVGEQGLVDAASLTGRLRQDIIEPIHVEGRAVRVGAGFGIGWAQCGMDAGEVIEAGRLGTLEHARFRHVTRLAKAVGGLACVQDREGRLVFARILGEELSRTIEIRGVRQGEDAVALVRAALQVPGGEHILVEVARILEGGPAAEELAAQVAVYVVPVVSPGGRPAARAQRLVDAVEELECVADLPGRRQFGDLLGDELDQMIEIRGAGRREDVVVLVRAALKVPGGEQVLVDVVRILEGGQAADELARLVTAGPGFPVPGVLSAAEEDAALTLLRAAAAELSVSGLRDALTDDLNGLELPAGLPLEALFAWLLHRNAQPDGLPPAVLLVEHASRLVSSSEHRIALARWAGTWAENVGQSEALRRRRGAV
ncbi:SAV_2336 N-terminal domain-related protein [Streptomyces sp. NPDC002623]